MYLQPRLSASYYHRRKDDVGEEEKEVVAEFFHSLAQADRCHRLRVATNRPTDHRVFSLSPLSFFLSLSLFLSFSSLRAHAPVFLFMKSRRRREKEKMRETERDAKNCRKASFSSFCLLASEFPFKSNRYFFSFSFSRCLRAI